MSATILLSLPIGILAVIILIVAFWRYPGPPLNRKFLATEPTEWKHYAKGQVFGFSGTIDEKIAVVFTNHKSVMLFFEDVPSVVFILGSVKTAEWRHFKKIALTTHRNTSSTNP